MGKLEAAQIRFAEPPRGHFQLMNSRKLARRGGRLGRIFHLLGLLRLRFRALRRRGAGVIGESGERTQSNGQAQHQAHQFLHLGCSPLN